MKILFSPEFSGHVFIGLSEQQPELMDTMVCDTMGLVAMLEQPHSTLLQGFVGVYETAPQEHPGRFVQTVGTWNGRAGP